MSLADETMKPLSGSFRLSARECDVIHNFRIRQRISVNHIAAILSRSVDTIHNVCQLYEAAAGVSIDNRKTTPASRSKGRASTLQRLSRFRLGARFYIMGIFDSVSEAISSDAAKKVGDYIIEQTEKSGDEEAEDPS